MGIPGWSKGLLLSVFVVNLRCYSLSSDCSATPLAFVAPPRTVMGLSASWRSYYDNLGAFAVSDSLERIGNTEVPSESRDGATPRSCLPEGDVAAGNSSFFVLEPLPLSDSSDDRPATSANDPAKAPANLTVERVPTNSHPQDSNREIYYRNKTELAFDLGTFPINIPFPFDFMEGDPYTEHPIKYTLVPLVLSLRWQMSDIGGPWIFRGNWDLTSSGSFTWIPSGPETRFISYDMGIRRNFVPHNRNWAPYFDIRLGVGQINAKGPKGVPYAQGEDWPEFTMNMGSGLRYNFSQRFAFSAGLNYMHLSNMDLSEHKPNATDPNWGPINYGINVYGPQLGINMRLGRPHQE